MANFNKTIIVGNVGRDATLRYTPTGKAVCDFSVAVTKKWTGADGSKQEETTWFKATTWGNQAETANKYVKRGMPILLEGTVTASAYMDKQGKPAASLELTVRTMQFLGRANGESGAAAQGEESDYQAPDNMDDIPF